MPDLSRYDADVEAVAWARAKVVQLRDKYREFQNAAAGNADRAGRWLRLVNMLDLELIGGEGCVIAAFDERLPAMAATREPPPDKPPAMRLLEEALFLRQYGECVEGGDETWLDWDRRAVAFMHSLQP